MAVYLPKKSPKRLKEIIQLAKKVAEDPDIRSSEFCRDCLMHIEAHANMVLKHINEIVRQNRKFRYNKYEQDRVKFKDWATKKTKRFPPED
jgi:hypothetical protein